MIRVPDLFCLIVALVPHWFSDYTAPVPTQENFEAWVSHILPAEEDLAHERIPWITSFSDGLLAANEQQKPLLFWGMNGHPLGCT